MNQFTKMFLRILAITVLCASCSPGESNFASPPVRIDGLQTNLFPVLGNLYLIAAPDLYKPPHPGPALSQLSRAWSIGNEFVFRTALRAKYKLPAGSSRLLQNGDALISFTREEGGKELTVLVHLRSNTVELTRNEP
jgi:hypothetical protein